MAECKNERGDGVLRVGGVVPDFTMNTFNPKTKGFGQFDLAKQKENGRWTILFFYPADYTFV